MLPEDAALEAVGAPATGAIGPVAAPAGVVGPGRVAPIVVAVAAGAGRQPGAAPVAATQVVVQDVAVTEPVAAALIAAAEEADLAMGVAARAERDEAVGSAPDGAGLHAARTAGSEA